MTTDVIAIIVLFALITVLVWARARRKSPAKPQKQSAGPDADRPPAKRPHALKAWPATALIEMPDATDRLFTYRDERMAATARQRLWIRYEDRSGNVTERAVEIYQPEDDEYIFSWCCSKLEPRTFARRSIQSWRLLPERFEFDPIVNQYWEEEGTRDMSQKMPWRRWLETQPDSIANRYS